MDNGPDTDHSVFSHTSLIKSYWPIKYHHSLCLCKVTQKYCGQRKDPDVENYVKKHWTNYIVFSLISPSVEPENSWESSFA